MGVDLDLSFRPAAEMAARVADRTESPAEMVERTLARIAEVQPAAQLLRPRVGR
ncbi:MAG: hypothetical protein V9E82_03340 [Candidatus Nanopelagicales bacterium]